VPLQGDYGQSPTVRPRTWRSPGADRSEHGRSKNDRAALTPVAVRGQPVPHRARRRPAVGRHQRGPVPPGLSRGRVERARGDGGQGPADDSHARHPRRSRGGFRGRRPRYLRGHRGPDLRPVLHDEAAGAGHGARPRHRPGYRGRSRGPHRGAEPSRQGQRLCHRRTDTTEELLRMSRPIRVLVADDEIRLRELLVRELGRKGHEVEGVGDGEAALTRLRDAAYDVVILDMKMPRKEGIDVLRELGAFPEHPQVIVMTGFQEVTTAVEAMKLGAYDYLTKPTKIEELDVVIRKAAEKGQLLRDNQALRAHAPGASPFGGILTKSGRMREVMRVVERVAPTDSAVLVLGESGTGKELVARAIHERSARAQRPFVPIHCGALPREVLESELFGHEKGAFTGAIAAKPGLIDLADGGTLLL